MNKIDTGILEGRRLPVGRESASLTVRPAHHGEVFMSHIPNAIEGKQLSVKGLTHSYGGQNAIDDISFEINAGEIVALLGPSGCGKSTVLRAIAGLIQPKSGGIHLGGQDLANVSARPQIGRA